jgi:hypothetical protein
MPGAGGLGDSFGHMDRAKVPMRHSFKTACFVALRRAWFMFEATVFGALVAALKANGLTDAQIEAKQYHDFDYFRRRVPRPRATPPTSACRVRLERNAGGRAKKVLVEILAV